MHESESEVAQSCPTLSDPMDCSLPGSYIHGIFQARVLEWGAIAFFAFPPWASLFLSYVSPNPANSPQFSGAVEQRSAGHSVSSKSMVWLASLWDPN